MSSGGKYITVNLAEGRGWRRTRGVRFRDAHPEIAQPEVRLFALFLRKLFITGRLPGARRGHRFAGLFSTQASGFLSLVRFCSEVSRCTVSGKICGTRRARCAALRV